MVKRKVKVVTEGTRADWATEVQQCPLVLPYRKDNFQVVQHFDLPREAFLAPAHHVVLTEEDSQDKHKDFTIMFYVYFSVT